MKIIIDYNRTIFDPEADTLYPGAFEALESLSRDNRLFLVSRNEPHRESRLKDLGIRGFFEEVSFVGDKTEEIFLSLIGDDKSAIVVGDSIRDEIRIGNNLGLPTVRVLRGRFSGDTPAQANEVPRYKIRDLSELQGIIKDYER